MVFELSDAPGSSVDPKPSVRLVALHCYLSDHDPQEPARTGLWTPELRAALASLPGHRDLDAPLVSADGTWTNNHTGRGAKGRFDGS